MIVSFVLWVDLAVFQPSKVMAATRIGKMTLAPVAGKQVTLNATYRCLYFMFEAGRQSVTS